MSADPRRIDQDSSVSELFTRVRALERKPAAGGSGIEFDIDNVGGWLMIEATGQVAVGFSQPAANFGDETSFGIALNVGPNGLQLTGAPTLTSTGNAVLNIEQIVLAGGAGAFGLQVTCIDNTAGGSGDVTGAIIQATSKATSNVGAIAVVSTLDVGGVGDSYGVQATASNLGTGREIGLFGQAGGHKVGASSLALLLEASGGAPIFEVRDDGSIHGLAAIGAITWDL